MKRVIVKDINNYNYILLDEDGNTYNKNCEFYGNYKPNIGDTLYIDESILNDINLFAFDDLFDSNKVRKEDIIKVVNKDDNNEYYLQRRFG